MKKKLQNVRGLGHKLAILGASTLALAGTAMAQTENAGAQAVTTQVNGLVPVAAAVVSAAVLVVVVPWGAKMAVRAFKSIGGA